MFKITMTEPDGHERTWDGNAEPDKDQLLRNRPAGTKIEVRPFTLEELLEYAKNYWNEMAPEEQKEMLKAQRQSFVRAEMGFGSDADEAAYRKALEEEDDEALERLNEEANERMRLVDEDAETRI